MSDVKKIIAARLKEARLAAGLSQEDVRVKLGYKSTGTISQHESGLKTPLAKELAVLAKLYGVSINWIYGDEPNAAQEEFSPEIRAIARGMKNLSSFQLTLLKSLVKDMSERADEELKK